MSASRSVYVKNQRWSDWVCVECDSSAALTEEIRSWLKEGYDTFGGLHIESGRYHQVVVKWRPKGELPAAS